MLLGALDQILDKSIPIPSHERCRVVVSESRCQSRHMIWTDIDQKCEAQPVSEMSDSKLADDAAQSIDRLGGANFTTTRHNHAIGAAQVVGVSSRNCDSCRKRKARVLSLAHKFHG